MLVPVERTRDPRFGGPGAYQRAVRLRVIRAPRVMRWGMGGVLEDAEAKLVAAGWTGAQCRTERVSFPGVDPNTGKNYYEQNICSVPGVSEGFMADVVNMSTAPGTGVNLAAERAYYQANDPQFGQEQSYFQTYSGPNTQVIAQTSTAATNPPSTTATYPVTATLRNVSRPGSEMRVGDRWQLDITGRPSSPVSVTASHNGHVSTASMGSTNASGRLALNGTYDASVLGTWQQTWTVAGQSGSVSFSVLPAATLATPGTSCPAALKTCPDGSTVGYDTSKSGCVYLPCPTVGGNGGSNGGGSGLSFELFDKTFSLGGFEVPVWAAAAGAVGLFFMLGGRR
jgi:hypothetical protein